MTKEKWPLYNIFTIFFSWQIQLKKIDSYPTFKDYKIRVIQGNNSGITNTKGDICWPGKRLFSEGDNSTIRQTLFIRKNVDGTRDLAVFDSEFEYYRKEDKMYVYKAINKPKILINAPCKVHLMSNSNDKLKALELVLKKGT